MPAEYEPLFDGGERDESDLEAARPLFRASAQPFLRRPWGWLAWGIALPAAALLTAFAARRFGALAVLFLWSGAILCGGVVEGLSLLRRGDRGDRRAAPVGLARWAMRSQGNLSLVAVALSLLLLTLRQAWALPALWLLLLGHSLWTLGGLAFTAWRRCGAIYQVGGLLALWPGPASWPLPWPLLVFAAATAIGNLWVAAEVWRLGRQREDAGLAHAVGQAATRP